MRIQQGNEVQYWVAMVQGKTIYSRSIGRDELEIKAKCNSVKILGVYEVRTLKEGEVIFTPISLEEALKRKDESWI